MLETFFTKIYAPDVLPAFVLEVPQSSPSVTGLRINRIWYQSSQLRSNITNNCNVFNTFLFSLFPVSVPEPKTEPPKVTSEDKDEL